MDFLFTGLTNEQKVFYLSKIKITTKTFLRNEVIFSENETCNHIAFINTGSVTAKRYFSDGHESIIRVLSNNDTIGEALIFSNDNTYKASFISDTKSLVSFIKYDDIILLIKDNSTIALNLLNKISNSLVSVNNQLKILSKRNVRSKLCEFLHLEAIKNNSKIFTISSNKTELALLLNVERPTLSKEIKSLIDEQIISNVGYAYTIIDYKKLEKYL